VAPPRLNGKRVGLFATRSPHRPNPIGLSLCKIDSVNTKTGEIVLSGADLIDGTPILDIKPFIQSYDDPMQNNNNNNSDSSENKTSIFEPSWVKRQNFPDLKVDLTETAWNQLNKLELKMYGDNKQKFLSTLIELLKADPRSVYRKDKTSDRLFFTNHSGPNSGLSIDILKN